MRRSTRALLAGKPRSSTSRTIRGEPYAPFSSRWMTWMRASSCASISRFRFSHRAEALAAPYALHHQVLELHRVFLLRYFEHHFSFQSVEVRPNLLEDEFSREASRRRFFAPQMRFISLSPYPQRVRACCFTIHTPATGSLGSKVSFAMPTLVKAGEGPQRPEQGLIMCSVRSIPRTPCPLGSGQA